MPKISLTRQRPDLYHPTPHAFALVDVPPMTFLMVDGHGDPNTAPAYAAALATLYPVAYRIKMLSKTELGRDYVVPPLEGLWWADEMARFTSRRDKSRWDWTMMIRLPDWITPQLALHARSEVAVKKNLPALPMLRVAPYAEGLAAQIMHIGPYDAEGPTLARLHHEWLPAHGYAASGKHHEIYLSDARRAAPARLRTVLRQPIRAVAQPDSPAPPAPPPAAADPSPAA